MAQRMLSWTKTGAELKMRDAQSENKDVVRVFDMKAIYPNFLEFNEVQQFTIAYGFQQILADAGSAEKTLQGKVKAAGDKWADLLNGKLKSSTKLSEDEKIERKVNKLAEKADLSEEEKALLAKIFGKLK